MSVSQNYGATFNYTTRGPETGVVIKSQNKNLWLENSAEYFKSVSFNSFEVATSTLTQLTLDGTFNFRPETYSVADNALTVKRAGVYLIKVYIVFEENPLGRRTLVINRDGDVEREISIPALSGDKTSISLDILGPVQEDDVYDFRVFQNTGSAIDVLEVSVDVIKMGVLV